MLRLIPPLTPEERERVEAGEVRAAKLKIRAALLRSDPALVDALNIAREALDRGYDERHALILLVAVLEDSRGETL